MNNEITYVKKHTNHVDRVGEIVDKFLIVEELGRVYPKPTSKQKKKMVRIQCLLCGRRFDTQYINLKIKPKVCCDQKNKRSDEQKRIYKTYFSMKQRCYNDKNPRYDLYGGRGIKVCKEWLDNKEEFYIWSMNNGYNELLTIDRIDNDDDYRPDNCRWADEAAQSRNRRHVISEETVMTIKSHLQDGLTHKEIADRLQVSKHRISNISSGKCWANIQRG